MLAKTDEIGNLAQVRREVNGGYNVGDFVDYGAYNPFAAEIVPGITPLWHVIETHPNHERTAAAHLIARRFGVFIPEIEETLIRRGRKIDVTRLMFRGYLFVFVWSIMQHLGRIETCPGVARVIFVDDEPDRPRLPAVISDKKIDEIRAVENSKRPLAGFMVDEDAFVAKKKRRWSKKKKEWYELQRQQQLARDNEIVACRPWSPFQDSLLNLDNEGRNQAMLSALEPLKVPLPIR
jgi:transcription antitermination factor NusG